MLLTRVAGALVGLAALALAVGGDLGHFIYPPSILLVGGILVGGMLFAYGARIPLKVVGAAILGRPANDHEELVLSIGVLNLGSRLSIAGGAVGMFVGFVGMLVELDDPSSIGPAMAVLVLSQFYGVVLSELVFQPLKHALIRASVGEAGDGIDAERALGRRSAWIVLFLSAFAILAAYMILDSLFR